MRDNYLEVVKSFVNSGGYKHTAESSFESLDDWSLFNTLKEVKQWFSDKQKAADIIIEDIPIKEVKDWIVDTDTGNIYHKSKEFFIVHGVRVKTKSREIRYGWDQPIIEQVGYDGGLLGIIRKRFEGVPHYLCEAKMEPGNYGKIQLSPTLQATFSNINKAHEGRKPYFVDFFENTQQYDGFEVLFDAWLAEDGGRFYLKRNRGLLVEVPEDFILEIPNDNFIWLSLYQIKKLLKEDAWVNPHIRGILAHV